MSATLEEMFNKDSILDVSFFNFENAITAAYFADAELNIVCLLYTSPSPRDGLLSRMPSSA